MAVLKHFDFQWRPQVGPGWHSAESKLLDRKFEIVLSLVMILPAVAIAGLILFGDFKPSLQTNLWLHLGIRCVFVAMFLFLLRQTTEFLLSAFANKRFLKNKLYHIWIWIMGTEVILVNPKLMNPYDSLLLNLVSHNLIPRSVLSQSLEESQIMAEAIAYCEQTIPKWKFVPQENSIIFFSLKDALIFKLGFIKPQ